MITPSIGFSIPGNFWIGLLLGGLGLGMILFLQAAGNSTKFLWVDEGIEPDKFWRRWTDNRQSKRSRPALFFMFFAAALILSGCMTMLGAIAT